MKAEFINPFVNSTINVLKTMCQTDPKPGKPTLKQGNKSWGEVSGLIGMASDSVTGNLVISFDKASIVAIVSKMLMEQFSDLTPEVVDAVGEITNMISGGAKKDLSEQGLAFNMATPVMIVGKDVEMRQLNPSPIVQIPFTTPEGTFVVEANLAAKKAA